MKAQSDLSELRKLTEEGMITFETAITGNVPKRENPYDHRGGEKSFRKWLGAEDQPISPTPKEAFRLRVFFQ